MTETETKSPGQALVEATPTQAVGEWFQPTGLEQAMKLAAFVAKSTFIPEAFRGKPGDIVAAMMLGASVGLSPVQALMNTQVIKGTPTFKADAMIGICQRHPDFEGYEDNAQELDQEAIVKIKRRGGDWVTRKFSMEDAKRAGLAGKDNWKKWPKDMLLARARSRAARATFQDALMGIYSTEEMNDVEVIEPADVTVRGESVVGKIQNAAEQEEVPEEPEDSFCLGEPEGAKKQTKTELIEMIDELELDEQLVFDKASTIKGSVTLDLADLSRDQLMQLRADLIS